MTQRVGDQSFLLNKSGSSEGCKNDARGVSCMVCRTFLACRSYRIEYDYLECDETSLVRLSKACKSIEIGVAVEDPFVGR